MIGEVDIEEDCIAELIHQKADLYIDAYQRNGIRIGLDVLQDISRSHVSLVATRKSTLMAQASYSPDVGAIARTISAGKIYISSLDEAV